jgi:MFS transporter, OFA family, oxalate/formate antiporter
MNFSRGLFLIQSIMMMVLLGTVYVWGVFRVEVESLYGVSATLSGLPYMVSLVSYALGMLIAGKWMATHRTLLVIAGVILFVGGLWLSSVVDHIYALTFTYGLCVGTGVGFLYGVPTFIVQKTFHKNVGLITGFILMGFGLSNSLMTPVVTSLLTMNSIQSTFSILGWVALLVFLLCIWPLFQSIPNQAKTEAKETLSFDLHAFRSLYVVFVLSLISGLTIIGLSYRIGVVNYGFDEDFVTIAIAVFALFNGLSRPFFGQLVDRFGFFKVAFFSLISLVTSGLISVFNGGQFPWLYAISYGAFWFGLGNWMALMPLSIQTLFPKTMFSKLYGILFTAYGLAAIIGTLFSGVILDLTSSTWPIYAAIVLANSVNLVLVLWLKKRYQLKIFN